MNIITLSGGISPWWISADMVRRELSKVSGDIEIQISSFGGSFYEGMEIFNLIRNYSKTKGKVTTVNLSKCMSAGSHIFLAGDTRKAYANSTIMCHNAWNVAYGNANDLRREVRILDGIDDVQASIYAKYQNRSKSAIKTDMANEMWYIGEDQLLDSGFVDEIIEGSYTDEDLQDNSSLDDLKTAYTNFMQSYKVEYEKHDPNTDFNKIEKSIKVCKGNCTLVENPTVGISESKIEKNTGATMTVEEVQAELKTAKDSISTQKAEIDSLKAEVKTQKEQNDKLAKGVVDLKAKFEEDLKAQKETSGEIVASAFKMDVSAEVAIDMVKTGDVAKANQILIDALGSNGVSTQGEKPKEGTKTELSDEQNEALAQSILEEIGV